MLRIPTLRLLHFDELNGCWRIPSSSWPRCLNPVKILEELGIDGNDSILRSSGCKHFVVRCRSGGERRGTICTFFESILKFFADFRWQWYVCEFCPL